MHKKPPRDKKTAARNRHAGGTRSTKTIKINDLLSKRPLLARLSAALPAQQSWLDWLRAAVPAELAAHIVNVVPKAGPGSLRAGNGGTGTGSGGELVIFTDSAAWGTRLRYVLAGIESQIRARDAAVARWRVRIAPGGR